MNIKIISLLVCLVSLVVLPLYECNYVDDDDVTLSSCKEFKKCFRKEMKELKKDEEYKERLRNGSDEDKEACMTEMMMKVKDKLQSEGQPTEDCKKAVADFMGMTCTT